MDKQTFYEELKRKEKKKIEIIVFVALLICFSVVLFLVLNNRDKEYFLEQTYVIGDYECSQKVFWEGEDLKPDRTEIDLVSARLDDARIAVDLASFQLEDDGEDVYNEALLKYNALKENYLELEAEYNNKVINYNNYIKEHCEKKTSD